MTDARPTPLTPPDCDLRKFHYMPLDVARLLDSDTFTLSNGDEFKAAIALWAKAWHQVPAGSLTNDERALARIAGVSVTQWRRIAPRALAGFVECKDGRLYHRIVCEKALEAWGAKQAQKARTEAAREARERKRAETAADDDTNTVAGSVTEDATGSNREGEGEGDSTSLRSVSTRRADVDRAFEALWSLWPPAARRRHTQADVRKAIDGQLKAGASADDLIAAGRAHVAERTQRGDEFVKGLKPWLSGGLWRNWLDSAAPETAQAEWAARVKFWRTHGDWNPHWGPKPDEAGFRGPEATLFDLNPQPGAP